VTSGRGRGYVIATASSTVIGTISDQVREGDRPDTSLQHRMDHFAKLVGIVILLASLLAFAIGIVRGEHLSSLFVVVVAMAVAAIPEGLPVAITITLAVGVRRMARRNAIVRRLPAVEILGSTTTIGSDKTGTLTENLMTVRRAWTAEGLPTLAGMQPSDTTMSRASLTR
jgi:P-type E1-E2 ATPase